MATIHYYIDNVEVSTALAKDYCITGYWNKGNLCMDTFEAAWLERKTSELARSFLEDWANQDKTLEIMIEE